MRPPEGYELRQFGDGQVLVCRADRIDSAVNAGLASPERWSELLSGDGAERSGRGTVRRLQLPGNGRLVLKRMRRGGAFASVRGDRFFGTRRLLRNLTVPLEAIRRGAPTPQPVLLLVGRRTLAGVEAWLGVEEIPEATDLRARLAAVDRPEEAELRAAMRAVRLLHDAGVVHPDLNLANLMTRREGAGWVAFVVDLDGARICVGPAPLPARRAALRRIERSYCKWFPDGGPVGPDGSLAWYRLYAGSNEALLAGLTSGRAAAGVRLAVHRAGWKLRGRR